MAAPREAEEARGRQVLVDLIRFVVGDRSETVADALIARHGSAERVLTCGATSIMGLGNDEVSALRLLAACRTAIGHCLDAELHEKLLLDGSRSLVRYLNLSLRFREIECAVVLHLDVQNRLISDELVSEGSIDQAQIHPREVVRRALELGSAAIILVHNHPSGNPEPSHQDLALTKKLAEACRTVDVVLHDHIIIARSGYASFRDMGLL